MLCNRSGRYIDRAYDGVSGPIWLDNVQCTGNESSIIECRHNGWGVHDCLDREIVSVRCSYGKSSSAQFPLNRILHCRYAVAVPTYMRWLPSSVTVPLSVPWSFLSCKLNTTNTYYVRSVEKPLSYRYEKRSLGQKTPWITSNATCQMSTKKARYFFVVCTAL